MNAPETITAPALPALTQATLDRKRRERDEAINALVQNAPRIGEIADRAFWSMMYDFERAPITTNARQLAEIGVAVPEYDAIASLSDDAAAALVTSITDGLAALHVYVLHTDHLSDRQLLEALLTPDGGPLVDAVRDTPAIPNAQDWIDFATGYANADVFDRFYGNCARDPRPYNRDATLPRPRGFVAW